MSGDCTLKGGIAAVRQGLQAGDIQAAQALATALTQAFPRAAQAWLVLGETHYALAQWCEAETVLQKAIGLRGDLVVARFKLAEVFVKQNRKEAALGALSDAVREAPDMVQAHSRLAALLRKCDRASEAIAHYRQALALDPNHVVALVNLGSLLRKNGAREEAEPLLRQAIKHDPNHFSALYNLARILLAQKAFGEARDVLHHAQSLRPREPRSLSALALAVEALDGVAASLPLHDQAVAAASDFTRLRTARGIALIEAGRAHDAVADFRKATVLEPESALRWRDLGSALHLTNAPEEAVVALQKALDLDPSLGSAQLLLLHDKALLADWSEAGKVDLETLGVEGPALSPWMFLMQEDAPRRQQMRSRRWAQKFEQERRSFARPAGRPNRLHIGYVSSDIHAHATLFLMAGLFRNHDPERFKVSVYSYGPEVDCAERRALEGQIDALHSVHHWSDSAIGDKIRADQVHIAVDLKGYTDRARPSLFASGLAPVQIAHVGYPGTSGAPFIDYLVADRVVVPPEFRPFYDESLIMMPHSYQPTDNQRRVAQTQVTRAQFGLPEDAVVLCSFNSLAKVGAKEFDLWGRILKAVPEAVLWVFCTNSRAGSNLRAAMERHGLQQERLVLAEALPQDRHLERLSLADLMLDSFCCNGHTTVSDALWVGVPVVTCPGHQFAARVGASLISAVELPQLVCADAEAYVAQAISLAGSAKKRSEFRKSLARAKKNAPLFDSIAYTRSMEAGFDRAFDRWMRGLKPEDLHL